MSDEQSRFGFASGSGPLGSLGTNTRSTGLPGALPVADWRK